MDNAVAMPDELVAEFTAALDAADLAYGLGFVGRGRTTVYFNDADQEAVYAISDALQMAND